MKITVEDKEDLEKALKMFDVEIIDDKKVQKDGRLYMGKDFKDKEVKLALLEVED